MAAVNVGGEAMGIMKGVLYSRSGDTKTHKTDSCNKYKHTILTYLCPQLLICSVWLPQAFQNV